MKIPLCAHCILMILCILHPALLQAQNDEIRTLLEKVEKVRGRERMTVCTELSKKFSTVDPVKGIAFGRQALRLADSMKISSDNDKIFNNLGINYLVISQLDTAMLYFKKALAAASLYNDSLQMGWAYNGTGIIYEKNGNFDSALIVFHKALNLFQLTKNYERTGRTLENIGTIHIHRGELKTSLSYLLEAKGSFEKAGATKNLPSLYIKIGRIYSETAEYATAVKWYEKGKQLSLENGNYQEAGIAINAMGIMYKNQGQNEEALKTYLEVVDIADKIKNKLLLLAVYGNIGNVYQSLGDYPRAIDFHQKALTIANSLNNPVEPAIQFVNLGNDYNSLKNYRNAMKYLEKALPVFTGTKTRSYLLSTYEAMITASNGLKNYSQSVSYYEKYVQLKDSLNKNELNTALDSLKVKFHTEQTEQENQALVQQSSLQEKTIKLQQAAILSALLAVILLVALIVYIQRSRRNMRRINKKLQDLSAFKDSMTHFLVHDLKNALNTIVNFDTRSDPENQIAIVKHSGKRMLGLVTNLLDIGKFENNRMDLTSADVSVGEVIKNAVQHLSIQAGNRLITIRTHPESDFVVRSDEEITERILVNLLENAIKHSPAGGTVSVFAESDNNMVRISIKDQGEGIPTGLMPSVFEKYTTAPGHPKGSQRSYGLGLAFCKLAVEAQGGKIGIESQPGKGTTAWFTLPMVNENAPRATTPSETGIMPQDELIPNLGADEIVVLQESCAALGALTIHQISDIKDVLKGVDASGRPGIAAWKIAVERAMYDCDTLKYQQLVNLICSSHE